MTASVAKGAKKQELSAVLGRVVNWYKLSNGHFDSGWKKL